MAWLTNWTYRKEITVTNENADYQTKVLVGESSGASGEEVDCGGHVAADFDDLRFTAADGSTLLDYWIESITGTTPNGLATVWVQNNATPDATLYMYYSGTETAVTDGAATFIVFDNFERGNDGDEIGGSWTEVQGVVEISTGQDIGDVTGYTGTRSMKLEGGATLPIVSIPATASDNIAIRLRAYKEDASKFYWIHGNGTYHTQVVYDTDEDIEYYDTGWNDTGDNIVADTWQLVEFNDFSWATPNFDIWHNDAEIQANATMVTASTYENEVRFLGTSSGLDTWIDDFIVRKWTATEPSFAFGSETTEGWANISHIKGIAAASISHKKGIAVASISHVKGVAV